MANCKNCTKFQTCKFVEKNSEFARQMYSMFEYPEWNNLDEIFYKNASSCKFYIDNNKNDLNDVIHAGHKFKFNMEWIHNYISSPNPPKFEDEKTKLEAIKDIENILKVLK
jgi:hypothetical protein